MSLAGSFTANVVKRVLPNGLTLLVQRAAEAPVVAVVTHVRAGYFDEPDEWVGIAHVLEHMFFKGTERRGPGEIARDTQLVGGYLNAGTIYDRTVYCTVLPAAQGGLERALDVQADALMHATIAAGELARELEVIVQEAKRKRDSPPAVASEALYALLFRVHRMRRWRIGTEDTLRRLTRDDVWRYYTTRYTPDRVIVALVGDLDVDRALALAQRTYGGWERPRAEVPGSPAEPAGGAARLRVMHGDVERPLARIGWRTVGTLHPDAAALNVAAEILGTGHGSRLQRGVRLPGLAHGVGASHYTPTEVGVFELGIEGEAGRLDAAVERSLALVTALANAAPGDEEVARVRALFTARWARRFETADGRAAALCEAEALGGYRLVEELYERQLRTEAADVRRVAATYLAPDVASAVFYLRDGAMSALDGAWPPAARGGGAPRLEAAAPHTMRARGAACSDAAIVQHAGGVRRWSAPGADVLVQPKRGTGLVTVGVHFVGVPTRETAADAGISWLVARSALRGAGGLSAAALAQSVELLGGALVASAGADTVGWWLTVRAAHLRAASGLLRAVALEPALDATGLAVEREQQAGDARSLRDDMFRYPAQRVLGEAFPGHAYGLPALGTSESVLGLGDDRVRRWAEGLGRQRAVVVAVGDLDHEALLAGVAPLADWPAAAPEAPEPRPPCWATGRSAEARAKAQTALAMAFPAAPFGSPDRYPLAVLGALLSGLAGRLFDELRERRSLAYTVAAMPWLVRRAGALVTYVATSPEREAEARSAMLAELGRVGAAPPAAAELERARNYAAGVVEVRRQRGAVVAGEILDGWVHDRLDELPRVAASLRAVTVDQLVDVAERVLQPERRAEYVVRGVKRET